MSSMIIDGNGLGYAAHGTKPLKVEGIGEVQAVFQGLNMLKKTAKLYPQYKDRLWLWDGKAQFRYDLYPEYKGNRRDTPEKIASKEMYSKVKPYLEELLKHLAVPQIVAPSYEADDLAGLFVRRAEKKGQQAIMITGDGDWMQLVRPNVCWYDPRTNSEKFVDAETFEEMTGFKSVNAFLVHKALMGDSSDNISSAGIGDKGAALLLSHFGSLQNMVKEFKRHGQFTKENLPGDEFKMHRSRFNKFCKGGIPLFKRNFELMNLNNKERDKNMLSNMQVTRSKFDPDEFEYVCRSLRFMSIVRTLDSWFEIFGGK